MPINTLNDYIASYKQIIPYGKTATRTTVANVPFTIFDIAGQPGAGTLAIGNTTSGVVPTDAVAGYPNIVDFAPGAIGHLSRVVVRSTVPCWIEIFDRVFAAGAFNFDANVTLSSQPSYLSRLPNGDYRGTELWMEAVTAFTGNQSIRVQYLDEGGAAGDTGTIATGVAPTVGRMFRIPLQAGDFGVSRVNVVTSTVSTAGTFNVMVMRRLFEGRVTAANTGEAVNMLRTGMPRVYHDSALYVVVTADGTSSGLPSITLEIASY